VTLGHYWQEAAPAPPEKRRTDPARTERRPYTDTPRMCLRRLRTPQACSSSGYRSQPFFGWRCVFGSEQAVMVDHNGKLHGCCDHQVPCFVVLLITE